MRVTVPFTYSLKYVPLRARTPRSTSVATTTEAIIGTVAPSAAELMFEVGNDPIGVCEGHAFTTFDGRPARVWDVGGSYYAEQVPQEVLQEVIDGKIETLKSPYNVYFMGERTESIGTHGLTCAKTEDEVQDIIASGVRSVDRSARTYSDQLVQKRTDDLKIIDGMLCVRVSEPCLMLLDSPPLQTPGVYVVACESHQVSPFGAKQKHTIAYGQRWRLDRKEELLEVARSLAQAKGLPVIDVTKVGYINKQSLIFNDEGEALAVAAKSVADAMREHLGVLPSEAGVAWYDLQDAIDISPERPTPALISALAAVKTAFEQYGCGPVRVRSMPYAHRQSFVHIGAGKYTMANEILQKKLNGIMERVQFALERWGARPRDGREWVENGLAINAQVDPAGDVYEVLSLDEATNIGRVMRVDLRNMAEMARDVGGHLVVSMFRNTPEAVALCIQQADGLESVDTVGPLGRPISSTAREKIDRYLYLAGKGLEDEMALATFGM